MAGLRDRDKQYFPLQSIQDVVDLFNDQLENSDQPNLTLLSLVLGIVENTLTVNRALSQHVDPSKILEPIFPIVELSTVEALYHKFVSQIRGSVDLTQYPSDHTSRELVKKISDVVWNSLTRSYYKDKAHLQSLYSYLTGNKLDCFGVAFAVVAACQVLKVHDVHLALSEDHAWVVFGNDGTETAEVTWHGKGNEDKRGQSIHVGVAEKSWLYLNGHPVVCTRQMEVAAMVSAINPAITATLDSVEMGSLQQDLLWLLYDQGHLQKYPMAMGNLGDLEEIAPTPNQQSSVSLFEQAIESAKKYYNNKHVYPYTYLGGYFYRKVHFKEAIRYWAEASNVIRSYNYNREDEEIYKEFLEIANELIPHVMKVVSLETPADLRIKMKSAAELPLLMDPEVYSHLLQFYDGICEWEEGSSTPVLHVGWAKHLVFSLSKFFPAVREMLDCRAEGEEEEDDNDDQSDEGDEEGTQDEENIEQNGNSTKDTSPEYMKKGDITRLKADKKEILDVSKKENNKMPSNGSVKRKKRVGSSRRSHVIKKVNGKTEEDRIKSTIEELASKVGAESQNETPPNPNIAALAQACGESILNPEYLLGGGEPFATDTSTVSDTKVDFNEFLSSKSNGSPFPGLTMDAMLKADSPADMALCKSQSRPDSMLSVSPSDEQSEHTFFLNKMERQMVLLHSAKMKGLKSLLVTSGKLNGSAIKLQLTAQSQVHLKHSKVSSEYDYTMPRKRARRD